MTIAVRRSNYYYIDVKNDPGEGLRLLSHLAGLGVDLQAFTAVPTGPARTQFALFPADKAKFVHAAEAAGFPLDGPHPALLVQGDDELGALAGVHETLYEASVDVYASSGVTNGKGSFGYVIYVQPGQFERAVNALGI